MEKKRGKEWSALASVVLIAVAILLIPPGLYLAGYFWLADVEEGFWMPERIPVVHRTYDAQWLARVFEPVGRLEERLLNHEVEIGHSGSDAGN